MIIHPDTLTTNARLTYFPNNLHFFPQKICVGEFFNDEDSLEVPILEIILISTCVIQAILAIFIIQKKFKYRKSTQVIPFNHQNKPKTNLGNLLMSWSMAFLLCSSGIISLNLNG